MAEPSLLVRLQKDGFVVVPSLLTPPELTTLREAAARIADQARAGGWPHIRTVGKQFPPWPSAAGAGGIWGVQHLLHPDLPDSRVFQAAYFSDRVMAVARALLRGEDGQGEEECSDDALVMELFNMLVRPGADFALRWHRDDVPDDIEPAEEAARLAQPAWHAQWNLALWEDESLIVVPGSHARARTAAERAAAPWEPELPVQVTVRLMPGDAVFYDNNILHRGVYSAARERMTLHGSVGHVKGSRARARNVLQHGVGEWVERCDFGNLGERERRRAEGMRQRLVKMGHESGYVGFSLQD